MGGFEITVKGDKEVERALGQLSPDAQKAMAKEKRRLAKNLAAKLRRAVISGSKTTMGRRVRPGIHQHGDTVTADNASRMLYGTEFGMNSKSGWYGRPEFRHHPNLQFKPRNPGGYWWHPTIQRAKPDADAAVQRALDDTLNHWGA